MCDLQKYSFNLYNLCPKENLFRYIEHGYNGLYGCAICKNIRLICIICVRKKICSDTSNTDITDYTDLRVAKIFVQSVFDKIRGIRFIF